MNPADRIPNWTQLRREASLLRRLIQRPPWIQQYEPHDVVTAIRAAFRRWAPAEQEPNLLMIAALWERLGNESWMRELSEEESRHVISRLARSLHLFALASEEGTACSSFGAACAFKPPKSKAPIVSVARFARLVNQPPETPRRLEALSRVFRYFRQKGVRVKPDDAENLLIFLFTDDPKSVVSCWANDYFSHLEGATPESSKETAPDTV